MSRSVRCSCCDITLNSAQQARQHYAGKAHRRRLLQRAGEPQRPETETDESRDGELEREAERRATPVVVDDVARQQLDMDAVSKATTLNSEGNNRDLVRPGLEERGTEALQGSLNPPPHK